MMYIVSSLVVGLALFSFTSATGTMQLNFKRDAELARVIRKRQSGSLPQTNVQFVDDTVYFADVSIGTPPQSLKLQLDTGSSGVWAYAPNVTNNKGGTFDKSQSSSFNDILPGNLSVSYGDGTYAKGDYFTDQLTIGGVAVTNFQMGLGLVGTSDVGLLGVGFTQGEATVDKYPNLVETMVSQNLISTTAYSVWLNDIEAASGSILFGGIDTAKYTGPLYNITMYPDQFYGVIDSMTVSFTSLTVTTLSGTTPINFPPMAVVLDTGTTASMLPDDIVEQLYAIAGAKWSPTNGIAAILCSARSMTGSFTFGFAGPNGPKIEVPISQLILPLVLNGTAVPATVGFPDAPADEQLCQLAISPRSALGRGPIQALLGDAFLRSAYVVFDLANERIGMAQIVFNTTDLNILPFASSGAPIPSATTVSEVPLTYAFTGTASAYTTQPVFTQTAPFFAGSAGLAFATEVASIEGLVATATQGTGNSTTTGTSSAVSSSQLFFCNQFILMEVVVGLFALGFVVIM